MQSLRFITSMATRAIYARIADRFSEAFQLKVELTSVGGVDAAKRVRAGEEFDLVGLASNVVDALIEEQFCVGTRFDVAISSIGIAIPRAHANFAVETAEDLKLAIQSATSIAYSTGPSGAYLERLFAQWDLSELVQQKLVKPPPGTPVAALVESGKVALGFQQMSELLGYQGLRILGPLPAEVQFDTVFSAALTRHCSRPAEAQRFLEFCCAAEFAELKSQFGMRAC